MALREASPDDGRDAQAAGLVRGQKNAAGRRRLHRELGPLLDGVHFAVIQGIQHLVVGLGDHGLQAALLQHCRAKHFVVQRDLFVSLGQDFELNHLKQPPQGRSVRGERRLGRATRRQAVVRFAVAPRQPRHACHRPDGGPRGRSHVCVHLR